ncbi:alpha-amylase family glycosyl hydrolase [Sphingobium phenoxybenzoativorans]|uniref:alpha-amylase family glycosyl hydrolase n=1 Tax=Sphingobium phenoxybenzoativorans TaxID=1592790 RepID=UPI000871EC38|nr:alpha-amylase family glycosyl hydrolase [Sphingobium phenoxybenzoativorans]
MSDSQSDRWWRGAVIYQVYPRSFADSNGDGIGDLPGITAKLDHIASLGVDAIWLSPFFTSPMRDFGYDVSDYCDVDPIFGTLADFDALIARAHALNLKVIIDQVYSHTSDQHAWFVESRSSQDNPKADWYVWADPKPEGSPPSNWQSVFGGPAWTWDSRRRQYYLHNFLKDQPQLNGHNPDVRQALLDTARFWLDRGADGFRLDALNFAMYDLGLRDNPPETKKGPRTRPFDYQQRLYNQGHEDIPLFIESLAGLIIGHGDHFTVAEVGGEDADREMKEFTRLPGRLNSAYGFTYLYAPELTAEVVREAIAEWPGKDALEGWPSWAFSNHDAPRHVTRWGEGRERDRLARLTMLLLTSLRGNIFIYQGEELGLPQAHVPYDRLVDPEAIANWPLTLGRDGARTPMPWTGEAPWGDFSVVEPWLPMDPEHLRLAVATQEEDPDSMLAWTRQMMALRKAHAAIRKGSIKVRKTPKALLVFDRITGEETVTCVFNLTDAPIAWQPDDAGLRILAAVGFEGEGVPASLPALSGYIAI